MVVVKTIQKTMTKNGGLTLPRALRAELNLPARAGVDIEVNEDNSVTIRKHTPTCFFTGTADDVMIYKGFEVSRGEVRNMAKEAGVID
jgi:bifunctional DNA-binding transcriptional regulator/antitoxin component of YhaV-PrlF toxin-antitoxin module